VNLASLAIDSFHTLFLIPAFALPLAVQAAEEPWTLATLGGDLHGTLLVPDGVERPPVVFMHPGSGPTDRDGNNPVLGGRNDSLRQLAEGLAAGGIATLRVDKRGIAGSKAAGPRREDDMRFEMFIEDTAAWALRLRESGRFGRLVLAGHSEGALVVCEAARAVKPDAIALLSAPGRPAPTVLREQLAGKLPPDLAAASERILAGLERSEMTSDIPPALSSLYRPSVQPYLVSWFRHDPVAAVAALTCRVLIVQGDADLQVTPEDARLLAAAQPASRLLILEGVNHVLKPAKGTMAEQLPSYRSPTPAVDARVIAALVAFAGAASGG
jgi:uncharacterized protein